MDEAEGDCTILDKHQKLKTINNDNVKQMVRNKTDAGCERKIKMSELPKSNERLERAAIVNNESYQLWRLAAQHAHQPCQQHTRKSTTAKRETKQNPLLKLFGCCLVPVTPIFSGDSVRCQTNRQHTTA